jgi:hypothetical protein
MNRPTLTTHVGLCLLLLFPTVLSQTTAETERIRAAIDRRVRTIGYEVTERKFGGDETVLPLEERDSETYKPSTRIYFRLRSLRPARIASNTYYRYWLFRETYDSEESAEKRVREYQRGYTERLATQQMSSFMISKLDIRVAAARRGTTVYMLVTDGAYILSDDKNRDKILTSIAQGKNT